MRNEGFVQQACLKVAQNVASTASSISGCAYRCDVQPGKSRCHARASASVTKGSMGGKYWYEYGPTESDEAAALSNAAMRLGGTSKTVRTWAQDKKGRLKKK